MSLRIGIGKLLIPYNSGSPTVDPVNALLTDGNTVGWYEASELSTITKDGSNIVSRWNDKLGAGHDFVTGSCLWVSPDYMSFNGTNQHLKCNTFVWNQPMEIYAVIKQVTWTADDWIWDGETASVMHLNQQGVSPNVTFNSGTGKIITTLPLNSWALIRVRYRGTTSRIQINNDAEWVGNLGTNNASGFWLGRYPAVAIRYGNFHVKEIICRSIANSDSNWNLLGTHLIAKYSI